MDRAETTDSPAPSAPVKGKWDHAVTFRLPALLAAISPDDGMYNPRDPAHYWAAGLSAVACIRSALWEVRRTEADCRTVLDLPCGHGRILRYLRSIFPHAGLTACDLLRDGVDFCARTFDATPVYSSTDPDAIALPDAYDLIWCGSLLTHLDVPGWDGFLRLFARSLAPGGLCLMTVHGTSVAHWLKGDRFRYGLDDTAGLIADYDRQLFGYRDYPDQPGYGISLSHPAWVADRIALVDGLRLVAYWERGWDHHQDVAVIQRAA